MILSALKSGRSITPLEALRKFNCMRLGARIWDLKQAGHNIIATTVKRRKKHFASYSLAH